MKKSLIALAVLAASGAAMAQSTVTLYGVVDAYVGSAKNYAYSNTGVLSSTTQTRVTSGGQNGSRWGIRVKEDLGGGLAAIATIEAGINADDGTQAQSGLAYGRQVFVGLSSGLGTVSLGRQYSAYDDIHGTTSAQLNNGFDVTNAGGANSSLTPALINNVITAPTAANVAAFANAAGGGVNAWVGYINARQNNSIKLQSASFAGFSGAVVYGFGENKNGAATSTALANPGSATYTVSGNLKYANGPLLVALAYNEDQITNGTSDAFTLKNTMLGVTYDAGFAKFFGNYNKAKFSGLDAQDEYAIGAAVPFGALTLVGQYAYGKGDDLGKNKGYGLEAWYDLSKRTRAYTSFAMTKKEILNNESNSLFGVGIRHSF